MSAAPANKAAPSAPVEPSAATRPVVVAHLLHTMAYGGVETIIINWLRAVDRDRVEPHLICFANPGETERPFVEAARRAGLSISTIPWSRRKPVFRAARALHRRLDEIGADVLHVHNTYAEIVGLIAARRAGVKILNTLYVWSDFGWKRNVQQWVSSRIIRRFDLVTSQCEQTMRDTTRRGVPAAMQRVLISGAPPSEVSVNQRQRRANRERFGAGDDHLVLANIARLYPEKAQDRLLHCFKRIHEARPNTRLWILGTGPLEEDLRATIRALDLDDAATLCGFVPDATSMAWSADIQVHPSRAEGVPLAICEGMVGAMPIVATAVGGVPEMIQHERTGLLVDFGDDEAFVRQTLRLIDDPDLRRRLGGEARRFVQNEYSLSTAVDRLASVYEELAR